MEIKSISATVIFIVVMTILGSSIIGVGEMSDHQDDDDAGWLKKIMKDDSWHKKFWDLFDFNKFKGFLNSQGSESSSNNFDVNDGGDDNPPPPPPSCPQDPTVTTMLANGDVKVTYTQSTNLNDNSYGVNSVGWGTKGHTFNALKNSDNLQVQFKKSNGDVVLDFYLDYLSVKSGTNSGYDSLGPLGGDGSIVFGSSSNIMSWSTSLDDNLNNLGFFAGGTQVVGFSTANLLIDSPPTISSTSYTLPFGSPFTGWNFVNSYTVTIKAAAFPGGFVAGGYSVSFPSVHNSPPKKCPVDGNHDDMIEHAYIDFGLDKVLVDPNEQPDTGDEYFDNLITECSFHSDESIADSVCVVCKLIGKPSGEHDGEDGVLDMGILEMPGGYKASTQLSIPLEHGVDVQKPVKVKIDVVQFIAKEEEHENDGHSTIVTNDGDGEDSMGTADSADDGDSSGGQDSEGDGDASGGQDSEDSGDSSGGQDSDDSGGFCGCVIDEEISEDSASSADSQDSGDSSGSQDSGDDGDSSGGQDSGDNGDSSGGQDSGDNGDSSGGQDLEDNANALGGQDLEDNANALGGQDLEDNGDSSGGQDSEGDGDSSGGQDSQDSGDSSGGQDSQDSGDSSGGQDSADDCDSSGGQDSEGDGDSSGGQDSQDSGDSSGGQDSADDGHASGSK